MNTPNFLIVVSQKAGTTSLHDILRMHPEANMSEVKEINFFTLEQKYSKGLEYYRHYFKPQSEDQKVTGESSPGYICHPGVAQKIRQDLGPIKIVIILRDPIKRALSQYWDNRRHLSEALEFEEVVDKYMDDTYLPERLGYISRGVYVKYIMQYEALFGRENLHIMILEDLIANQEEELRNLYRFLSINETLGLRLLPKASNSSMIWTNPLYSLMFKNPHYTKYLPKRLRRFFFFGKAINYKYQLPKESVIKKLTDFYSPWNKKLEQYLNRSLDSWL
ncbi:sulfotransferase domain-containing protein [Flavobacterium sp. MFBS3-15]|uniref:sulfotransferase domain-containing protein n=1 Tax=Flavobacterium sp. MFBS3-15 TaxID=2989816 RepID=UPI0022363BE6|nr:sulfotransferase domain-containing protein [Flavobacterium sp. MFBS3-15]MCW4469572.1 sulfotransferase domain-containing protein [Flavobacterium sp. MFBS3-15]